MSSSPISTAIRALRRDGVGSVWRKLALVLRARRARRDLAQRFTSDVPSLIDAVYRQYDGLLAPLQVESELTRFAELVARHKPRAILEIGTANGGTLLVLARVSDPAAKIVSVDLPGGDFGAGYPEWKMGLYRSFALPNQTISLIRDNSHSPETCRRVSELFSGIPIDLLFIDGDHTYEGVKQDFNRYSPLVRSGGLVAFHDIAEHATDPACQVSRFWNEIKRPDSIEIVEARDQGWAGIGVIRL